MMHHTQRLALNNGRVAFESGLTMEESNPYRRSSRSHGSFESGYREAEREKKVDEVALYLEAHVTIEPVFDERRDRAAWIAQQFNFKLADLLMKKRAADTEERSAKDTFMTGHSKSKTNINARTKALVLALQAAGFKVWRYKIEDTLLDSRNDDVWRLLT